MRFTRAPIPKIRQQVVEGASELAGIKASRKAATINARVRPYIVDAQTAGSGQFGATDLRFQTFGQFARIVGNVVTLGGDDQRPAAFPKPRSLGTSAPGVTVDLHLPSALSNLMQGGLHAPAVKDVQNVMIVTTPNVDNPDKPGFTSTRNVDWETYSAAVEKARASGNAQSQAIRVYKPDGEIEVAADAKGNLVVFVPDFTIEFPAPPQAARGGALTGPPARVYRLKATRAEFTISLEVRPGAGSEPPHIVGKVAGFDGGGNVQVFALNESDENPVALNALTGRIIATAFGTKLTGTPVDAPLEQLPTSQVDIVSASKLDPSGWMRLVVQPR